MISDQHMGVTCSAKSATVIDSFIPKLRTVTIVGQQDLCSRHQEYGYIWNALVINYIFLYTTTLNSLLAILILVTG